MSRVAISLTVSEHKEAEAAVLKRLRESAPGTAIAQVGGAIAALLVVCALFSLTKAEYPPSVRSNLSVRETLGILLLGAVTYFVAIRISKARIERWLYAENGTLLRPYT